MLVFVWYTLAGLLEIAGAFTFWAWLRMGWSPLWLIPGMISLFAYAFILSKVEVDFAGRAYAAYSGFYLFLALLWLWLAEGHRPDRWDFIGSAIAVAGAVIIIFGPRPQAVA